MHPVALLVMGAGAYGANMYLDDQTYTPEGIAEPQIGGFNARYVIGGLGLVASMMTGGLVGLLGTGAAVGSLLNAQTAQEVTEKYREAVLTFQSRSLARQAPVRGFIPPRGGSEVMGQTYIDGNTYVPALMAA